MLVVVATVLGALAADLALLKEVAPRVSEARHAAGSASIVDPEDLLIDLSYVAARRHAISRVSATLPVVPARASGRLDLVALPGAPPGGGRAVTYTVEIERGLPIASDETARIVARVLADRRGWRTAAGVRFVPVSPRAARAGASVDVRITIASPALADRLCAPLEIAGELSCWQRGRAVLNARRWLSGARTYGRDVDAYVGGARKLNSFGGEKCSFVAYVRTVKTASGATAVQIVHSTRRGARDIEHLGSAHDEAELEALMAAARQRLAEDQRELDLGLEAAAGAGPLEITASRMAHLWEALCRAYDVLGFDAAAQGDEVFRQLVLARIIEPTSKQDSARVLEEVGVGPASYATLKRRLPSYAQPSWRRRLAAELVCA